MPRLTTPPGGSSKAQRRATILRSSRVQRLDPVERHLLAPRIGVVVGRAVGLQVVLRRRHDDAVDEHARDRDLARRERVRRGDALDLRDHEPARVLRRHRGSEVVEKQRLPLHGDVAGGIGRGAAHERDLDREGLVEEPGLAAQLDELDELLGRAGVELAAAEARVDEGAKPDLRQRPGQPCRNVAVEMRDAAEGQVVGLDLVVEGERAELRHERPMPADDASHEPLVGEPVEAALLAVAGRRGKHQRQSGGRRRLAETLRQGDDQLVRGADPDEARDRDRVAVADERDRLLRRHDLVGGHAPTRLWPFGEPLRDP